MEINLQRGKIRCKEITLKRPKIIIRRRRVKNGLFFLSGSCYDSIWLQIFGVISLKKPKLGCWKVKTVFNRV